MNTWKVIAVTAVAIIGVLLMTASVLAYMGAQTPQTTYNPYSPNGFSQNPAGGMMRGPMGGVMGGAYPNNGYPQQGSAYPQPYGQGTGSWRGCH